MCMIVRKNVTYDFSNFGSLKSTETPNKTCMRYLQANFSNFGSLKSTETLW